MKLGPIRLLTLLNMLLAAGLAWLWLDEDGKTRNIAWLAPQALPLEVTAYANPLPPSSLVTNPAQYLAVLERPVFAPDRRPPPAPAPPPPPDPMASIQLMGIFSGPNAGILARVDGKVSRIKVNESLGSWTLKAIEGRDVTFAQGEENRQLRLAYAPLGVRSAQAETGTSPPTARPLSPQSVTKQNSEDLGRENIRRRNEIRAARGLPLITD